LLSALFAERVGRFALALLVGLLALPSAARGAGELDPTFSGDGKVLTDFGALDNANDVAIQPDGKIVAAGATRVGTNPLNFALARYNPGGSLDPSFDGDGKVVTNFGSDLDSVLGVAIQADGKIVAAGFTDAGVNPANFALARYNPDGSLDPTFAGDGTLVTDFGDFDFANEVAIQADGKIVAAGVSSLTDDNFALARYNPDGSLDPSFDGDGRVVTDFGGFIGDDRAEAVAIQADGKIVAAGQASAGTNPLNFALARYNPGGSLDSSFDGDGRVVTDFGAGDSASGVAIQVDGKVVAAGFTSNGDNPRNFALARYNPDGTRDPSFDGDGRVRTDFGSSEMASGVALQADGKIVAAGASGAFGARDFALARYSVGGGLDASFNGDGRVLTDFGADDDAHAVAIQADNKIVAAGASDFGPNPYNFALARYLAGAVRTTALDHFLYYRIERGTPAFQPRTVTVRDQFRTSQSRVVEPLRLLNPVSKNGGPISRPDAHLKCYRIEESRFAGRTVSVQNQFGSHTFQVRQPTRLCNPASKRVPPGTPPPVPSGLDHFRCYGVEGGSLNRPVTLRDQFGRQEVVVEEPEYLCNPASKNGSPIHNPAGHLVCYELAGVDPFTSRRASLRDQFGVQTFAVVRPTKLCVPSRKTH
jgi:uncharacterized delta-60 repeat protein